jgi:hypothetical protein
MIRHLTNSEIDKKKWDECVTESFNGMIFATSWYLDIVAENWEALIENDYERIFPLIRGKKWKINYLYQPDFTQQLGVISKSILTENVVSMFLEAIPGNIKFAEINLNTFNKVRSGNYKLYHLQSFEIDLINSYENLNRNYSANLKRNLKKAQQSGLSVSKNIKPDEVINLFRLSCGKKNKTLREDRYQKLKRLSYTGIYKGLMLTYGVYSNRNELIAGAILARSKNKLIFLFPGLTKEGKKSHAIAFLIDSLIHEHSLNHITLEMEGSNNFYPTDFYQSFGTLGCTYPHIVINRLPLFMRIIVTVVKRIKNIFRVQS